MVTPPAREDAGSGVDVRARSVEEMRDAIESLGARLAGCTRRCPGVRCDALAGAIPRCLIFEPGRCETLAGGVIVVGMNPGRADGEERELIRRLFAPGHDPRRAYAQYLAWLSPATRRIPFYTLMRAVVTTMGFTGPILWTEIVKCESGEPLFVDGGNRPVRFGLGPLFRETVRACRDDYLRAELAVCPPEWPIVAAGRAVGATIPDDLRDGRAVIVLPHPTGSAEFLKIFAPTGFSTSTAILDRIRTALATGAVENISITRPEDRAERSGR